MLDKIGESLLSTTGKIGDLIRSGKANSLSEFTASAHVLPVFLMDTGVSVMPEAESIVGGMLNYWAACYLMAAQLSVNIGEIQVTRQLERLNTRRKPLDASVGLINSLLAMESYSNGLPDVKTSDLASVKLESNDSDYSGNTTSSTAKGVVDRIEANSALSIGKTIEINWESKGERGTIVTSIRPAIRVANDDSMVNILTIGTKNISFKERWHGIKSGQLDWFMDGILATDVIKEMRKARMTDNTGYYQEALARSRKNKLSSILSLNPSVATFSSVFFITAETARDLEARSNINLEKFKDRQQMFENSFGMVLVIVDRSWKTCRIYTHGIEDHTTVSFGQMEGANKGKNGDIKEIFNSLMMSSAPRF